MAARASPVSSLCLSTLFCSALLLSLLFLSPFLASVGLSHHALSLSSHRQGVRVCVPHVSPHADVQALPADAQGAVRDPRAGKDAQRTDGHLRYPRMHSPRARARLSLLSSRLARAPTPSPRPVRARARESSHNTRPRVSATDEPRRARRAISLSAPLRAPSIWRVSKTGRRLNFKCRGLSSRVQRRETHADRNGHGRYRRAARAWRRDVGCGKTKSTCPSYFEASPFLAHLPFAR